MSSSIQPTWLAWLLPWALWISSVQAPRAFATQPFPPTVVRKENGKWQLQSGYLGGSRIFVIDANRKTLLWIRDALPKEEYTKYVREGTAGPLWEENAVSYFISLSGKTHFCMRTWWDRRVLIDLEAAKQVPDGTFGKELAAREKQQVLDLLKSGLTLMAKRENRTCDEFDAVHGGADLAGRMQLKEAVPFLKQLESVDYIGSGVGGGFEWGRLRQEEINPASYCRYTTRIVVQRSLRRLHETPAGYPATLFHYESGKEVEPAKLAGPRHEGVSRLEIGKKPIDVLNVLGAPDYVEWGKGLPGHNIWRYDMDAAAAYSLLVHWDEKTPRVAALEKVEPAFWAGNELIDPSVKEAVFDADGSIAYARCLYGSAFKGKISKLKPDRK